MPQVKEEYYLIIVWGTLVLLLLGVFIVVFVLQYQKKHKRHLEQKRALQNTLLQSQLEIKEQTLRHIARELHDNLGQTASLIKINLNTLRLEDHVATHERIEDTKDLVRQLIMDLKSLSVDLNSDRVIQLGLEKTIEGDIERINRTGQFTATFEQQGDMPALDPNKMIILYRMVQEILNNMIKHSHAAHIHIILQRTGNLFTLVCQDDGDGFDIEEKLKGGGSGLSNLKSRAKLIDAQLSIESSPGHGTKVAIELFK